MRAGGKMSCQLKSNQVHRMPNAARTIAGKHSKLRHASRARSAQLRVWPTGARMSPSALLGQGEAAPWSGRINLFFLK
jgi:hypothetical protein